MSKQTLAEQVSTAFGPGNWIAVGTSAPIEAFLDGRRIQIGAVNADDTLEEILEAAAECRGASCHANPVELCRGVSRWVFDDQSEILTDGNGNWKVAAQNAN